VNSPQPVQTSIIYLTDQRTHRRWVESTSLYCFEVRLNEVQPEIWRRFDIPSDWTFAQFHEVIQIVMGWTDSHLHEFVVADTRIGPRHSDPPPTVRDETRIKISDMFVRAKQEGLYLYDFGDGWEHSLTLGSVLPLESSTGYPRCLEGERACPPEDCGGPFGHMVWLIPGHPLRSSPGS
jgi:hypothetical protein